jgi:transcriptional regulator with XRE-family HTH domain
VSGHRPFREIRRSGPGSEARVAEHRRAMQMAMTLYELRRARGKTQTALAAEIGISQKRVSKIENSGNPELETLRAYIKALGGELEVRAVFPDQEPVTFTTV